MKNKQYIGHARSRSRSHERCTPRTRMISGQVSGLVRYPNKRAAEAPHLPVTMEDNWLRVGIYDLWECWGAGRNITENEIYNALRKHRSDDRGYVRHHIRGDVVYVRPKYGGQARSQRRWQPAPLQRAVGTAAFAVDTEVALPVGVGGVGHGGHGGPSGVFLALLSEIASNMELVADTDVRAVWFTVVVGSKWSLLLIPMLHCQWMWSM